MSGSYRHAITHINWRTQKTVNLKQDDFSNLYSSLDPNKMIDCGYHTVRKLFREDGTWIKKKHGYQYDLYLYKDGQYSHFWTNYADDSKNYGTVKENSGRKAISTVKRLFEEKTGTTLKKAFGYSPVEVKLLCSPKQFYFTNDKYMNIDKDIGCVSMVDFTSHYPSCVTGRLPDYHTAVTYEGTVKPTEEYPFALYMKSGHIAEYGVFDSHDWAGHELFDRLFVFQDEYKGKTLVHKAQHPFLEPEKDVTILMKASAYELGSVYAELYAKRKENEEFKNAMNKSIGYMATSTYKSFRLSHIRAFVIGRANAKMLEVVDKIHIPSIIQICVDGAAYIGKREQGVDKKALGTLHQEFTGAVGRFASLNCYIIEKDGKIIKVKHGCYNACTDGSPIDEPKSLDDIKKWYRQTKIYEEEDEDA